MNSAIFLDRDGTLNRDPGYISKIENLEFFSNTVKALQKMQKTHKLFIISNQSGVGRGYFSKEKLEILNKKILEKLNKEYIKITEIKNCTHHPKKLCACRKPKTKLIEGLIKKYKINITKSNRRQNLRYKTRRKFKHKINFSPYRIRRKR